MRALSGLGLILGAFWGFPGASEELIQRSGPEFCREVQFELREQLDEGMITEAEAAWTAIRCYDLFSDD